MKFKIISISIIFIILPLLSSCFVTSHLIEDEISCDQFDQTNHISKEFNMEVGDKITLKLCSNPSTGFEWGYQVIDVSVLKEEDHDFEESGSTGTSGTAGEEIWTFEALKEGTTELQMEYSQAWDGGIKKQWTYTMTITID